MIANKFLVGHDDEGERIDKYLATYNDEMSRSRIRKLLDDGMITVNGRIRKPNYRICTGDYIKLDIPDPVTVDIWPQDIPLDIVYEDNDIIVINKQKGLVVHPAPGHYNDTLVNALMFHCKDNLSGINGELRPGIVHRIDMNTTGLLVCCKNDIAHNFIAEQFKEHSGTRKYQAIVYNCFKDDEGVINAPLGRDPKERKHMAINYENGKEAITHYRVLERFNNFTHIECQLETGRTHQIRVHMASINHPLLGDNVYGPAKCPFNLQGQTLHAGVLGFVHPRTKEYVEFERPVPEYFSNLLEILRNKA
ncbi:MAG: RluA family pseudouridine synthase [Lachnospiraceae bacterium]|nr:RluA family pseudouridine synthase [Lachnospiraceae bacterium]